MKNKGGRPTSYKKEYNEQVRKLCLLGATDIEIADFFEVSLTTINNWKHDYPTFFESIKKGKGIADAEIAHSLYNRAKGIKCKEVRTKNDGSKETVERELPPDPVSMIFWLKNRQKEKWRDKHESQVELNDNKKIYIHNSLSVPDEIIDGN